MNEAFICTVCKVTNIRCIIYLLAELISDLESNVMTMVNEHEHSSVFILFKTIPPLHSLNPMGQLVTVEISSLLSGYWNRID